MRPNSFIGAKVCLVVYSAVAEKHERFDLTPKPTYPFPRCSEPWLVDLQTLCPLASELTRPEESITGTNVNRVSHSAKA